MEAEYLFIYASERGMFVLKVLFVTNVATGALKLAASLAGTISFLKTLGCLYDCSDEELSSKRLLNTISHRRQTYHINLC